MARKVTGNFPILEIALVPRRGMWSQAEAGYELMHARDLLKPIVAKLVDCDVDWDWRIQTDAVCEHCGYTWGEKSETFNGGCCDEDLKNDPESVVSA